MLIRAATDVGGTFTDLAYYAFDPQTRRAGPVTAAKVDTTPPEFQRGVMDALAAGKVSIPNIAFFAHGSTVVINAITERKGARVGLVTTSGFRDVLEIARGNRPDLFNFRFRKPPPIVERHLRCELRERCNHRGEIEMEPDLSQLATIMAHFEREQVEAVALCFLHAYRNPSNEQRVAAEIRRCWPNISVLASHEISREWREYERTSTTVFSAYVHPITQRYIESLERELAAAGLRRPPYLMMSNGGIATTASAKANPIAMVESGPASGIYAAAHLGALIGEPNLIVLDIGGTTAKCALIADGVIKVTTDYFVERDARTPGYPIQTPVSEIVEIGNGGGSIAWVDAGGKLHVGPRSAGAVPGPVAYGRGGIEPTTTDANLLLGRIDPECMAGGAIAPDRQAVQTAFERLGERLGVSAIEAARGVIRIANANMTNALRLVSTNRGYDPREFALIAFGGGGPMHAIALARELRVPRVIVPVNSAVFSAWGMLLTDLRHDDVQTQVVGLETTWAASIEQRLRDMVRTAVERFQSAGLGDAVADVEHEALLDMRYAGQEHTVKVPVPMPVDVSRIVEIEALFHDAHERRFTYRLTVPVEIVSFHLVSRLAVPKAPLPERARAGRRLEEAVLGVRTVDFDVDGVHEATIYDGARLEPSMQIVGPAIVQESVVTLVVPPGAQIAVDRYGNYHIQIEF